jgi:hypothetical protein
MAKAGSIGAAKGMKGGSSLIELAGRGSVGEVDLPGDAVVHDQRAPPAMM